MKDLIISRSEASKCPICNEDIDKNFKVVLYKDKKIWVHEKHYVEGGK